MATATASNTALQAVPAPAPERAARPDLRVVEPVAEERAWRSLGGLVGTFTVALLFVCIFGVVVFQVLLVQTQSQLDDLADARTEQESRSRALGLETATLESPERIVAAAIELGMVAPDDIAFLPSGDDRDVAYDPATEPVGTTTPTAEATSAGEGSTNTTPPGSTTPTTLPPTGVTLAPGPPYTAENNWGAGGPPTTPPVYGPENNWGADLATGGATTP